MARLFFLVATIGAATVATVGCSANTSTQGQATPMRAEAAPTPAPVTIRDNAADVAIRRDLTVAIARDADLQNREIRFTVTNGDINVAGIVRTEDERRKMNDLAMNIDGVKSVANALRVSE